MGTHITNTLLIVSFGLVVMIAVIVAIGGP